MSKYFDDSLAQPDRRPDIPTTSTAWPVLTSPEQREVRETSINEIGLALARIEQQQNGVIGLMNHRLAAAEESLAGLSAKLDTLSGQLQPLAGLSVQLTNVATAIRAEIVTDHEAVLRRIDKLGNDLFAALAVLKLRKNKHKRKKGKK
jgi:hypothetical protein